MINLHRFNRLGFTLLTLLFAFFVVAASSCSGESTDNETPADDEVEEEEEEINPYIEYDGLNGTAVNPIINQVFTADPSAKVFNDRIYVYTSHDLEDQTNYQMTDYHVFSSDDMVNWQDHGPIFSKSDTTWVTYLFAPDCAYSETTGKYYLYFPDSGDGIGVAVSDSPAGPFEDALDEPLVSRSTPEVEDVDWVFDPMCFIDDDGQAYLYFGGGMPSDKDNCRVIRLNDDMISLKDASATKIVAPNFFEAAFMNKRDGVYYLSYSTTFDTTSGEIDYMTSDDPMTGFEHKGTVLPNPPYNNGNNNHHSILEFGDNWYVFYHNRRIANREGYSVYQRSVTVDYLYFDENGDIITVEPTTGNVKQLKDVDAFSLIEAEMMADQRGTTTEPAYSGSTRTGVNVTDIHDKEWIGYSQVDFGTGAVTFKATVASDFAEGGTIDIYINGCDLFTNLPGEKIGSLEVKSTEGWQTWEEIECEIEEISGVHDLYLRFRGTEKEKLFNLDSFIFE